MFAQSLRNVCDRRRKSISLCLREKTKPTIRTHRRAQACRRRFIKNRHFGTSAFSKRWRCLAANSTPPRLSADSTGTPRSRLPSMPSMSKTREDPKLDLVAEILRRRGSIRLKVLGTSMLPSLWPGDLLTIQGLAYDEAVPGDLVLVLRNNRFFVHRLIERQRGRDCLWWITKGDALRDCDPPAAASELLGRVAGIRRGNRSFVPRPRVSQPHSALAWTLFRWDRLRNLTMRMHAARLRVSPRRAGQVLRRACSAVRWIPGISPSPTSRQ